MNTGSKIAELSEEIEELQVEEKSIMQAFDKMDATEMKKVEGEISKSEARIIDLNAQEVEFTGAISHEKEKFNGLKEQAADIDQDELADARFALRPQMEREGCECISKGAPDGRISFAKYQAAVRDADKSLEEDGMVKQQQDQTRKKEWKKVFHQEKDR